MKKVTNHYRPDYTISMVGAAYSIVTRDYVALVNYSPLVLVGLNDIHLTTHTPMTYTHSTHLADFGDRYALQLVVACGNYYRRLRTYVFSKNVILTPWERIREGVKLTPCVEPIVQVINDPTDQHSYADILR